MCVQMQVVEILACIYVIVFGTLGLTCCGVITGMRHLSKCDRQREQVTMATHLGLWLVRYS